jgi:hypothetical protein
MMQSMHYLSRSKISIAGLKILAEQEIPNERRVILMKDFNHAPSNTSAFGKAFASLQPTK